MVYDQMIEEYWGDRQADGRMGMVLLGIGGECEWVNGQTSGGI